MTLFREKVSDAEWGVFLDSRVMPEVDDDPRYHKFQPTLSERRDGNIYVLRIKEKG